MRYRVTAPITISATTVVFADSEEEAIDEALGRDVQSLCYGCSSQDPEEEWTIDDIDGEPDEGRIEEAD